MITTSFKKANITYSHPYPFNFFHVGRHRCSSFSRSSLVVMTCGIHDRHRLPFKHQRRTIVDVFGQLRREAINKVSAAYKMPGAWLPTRPSDLLQPGPQPAMIDRNFVKCYASSSRNVSSHHSTTQNAAASRHFVAFNKKEYTACDENVNKTLRHTRYIITEKFRTETHIQLVIITFYSLQTMNHS